MLQHATAAASNFLGQPSKRFGGNAPGATGATGAFVHLMGLRSRFCAGKLTLVLCTRAIVMLNQERVSSKAVARELENIIVC